jgi:hypothetical protein
MVCQLFEVGFYNQVLAPLAITHSPVGLHPEKFGVRKKPSCRTLLPPTIYYIDSTELTMRNLFGLKKSSISCMESVLIIACRNGLILKFQAKKIPQDLTFHPPQEPEDSVKNKTAKIVWLGGKPFTEEPNQKKGNSWEMLV